MENSFCSSSPASALIVQNCVNKDNDKCERDGGWSEWREWSSCDVNCGTGKRSQLRDCTNPFPLNDGEYCKGSNEKIEPCDKGPCPSK